MKPLTESLSGGVQKEDPVENKVIMIIDFWQETIPWNFATIEVFWRSFKTEESSNLNQIFCSRLSSLWMRCNGIEICFMEFRIKNENLVSLIIKTPLERINKIKIEQWSECENEKSRVKRISHRKEYSMRK